MEEPKLVVKTSVEIQEDGNRRFVETSTRPDPAQGGRSAFLQIRHSRPILQNEMPEQAAADSLAFTEESNDYTMHSLHVGPPGLGGFSAYHTDFPDGSFRYKSYARPDLVRDADT